ncbi:uncharacterized protein SPAPADRAFT_54463 [Spathaspora passalidarum NRRL Y-27907]|uniref:Uncharacterized protein n=1 Tax=Spathaspora passalidarum (strain NRRL Y-27907 / 11-Y1) TaxID=619300 RepID=G3AHZ6_SPAPN|nr:uncharacterized protein SPAPADRAFT_54463 [Spathaspora passalidarum NRRL Y-27907]EGW34310.1 hypothetical protein SPAPADRAFT_54463 [Spathaspora passalidarum NRRL Y-27907]
MINNLNLSLKINNKAPDMDSRPFTPIDATVRTPLEPPPHNLPHHGSQLSSQPMQASNSSSPFYFTNNPWVEQQQQQHQQIYQNPEYTESDDILTDIDEPNDFGRRNYTIYFTQHFDQLLMSIYSNILLLPTTTPFSGHIPPSGLAGRVANEIMSNLIKTLNGNGQPPMYDQQSIINREYLKNHEYQPIILQLIRKRLMDLCHYNHNSAQFKLPEATTTQVAANTLRHSSISNLSLNEMNISTYSNGNGSNSSSANPVQPPRSRSSSLNLRKQSLTRNNSNNWLHVGNMNNLRPPQAPQQGGYSNFNISTDSLQSIQDSVPQSIITRTTPVVNANNPTLLNQFQQPNPQYAMMMEYNPNSNQNSNTPPPSHKSSLYTPPPSATNSSANFNLPPVSDHEEFDYFPRARSGSRTNVQFPQHTLNIDTNLANLQLQPPSMPVNGNTFNSYRHNSNGAITLDSPFMSATTPGDDYYGGFPQPQAQALGTSPSRGDSPDSMKLGESARFNLPASVSLNEKKRDSLKLKRGIH